MSLLSRIHARTLLFFPNSIGKARTIPVKCVNKTSLILSDTRVNFFSTSQPRKFWPQLKIISMILINPILRYSSWAVGKILKKHWGRLPLEQRLGRDLIIYFIDRKSPYLYIQKRGFAFSRCLYGTFPWRRFVFLTLLIWLNILLS